MEEVQLKERQQSFKMIIPEYVEGKIRRAATLFPKTEWSGILFYKYTGSIENNDLIITCEDIHPMNIGTSGYTQFKDDATIIGFMVDNDLMDCELGLVHSHNIMATNFSGEDLNTLKVDGAERNNFVSLIVNNAGTYTAKITSKETCKATIKRLITTPFFSTSTSREESEETEYTIVYHYPLTIEIQQHKYEDLDARFEELKATAGKFEPNERSAWNKASKFTLNNQDKEDTSLINIPSLNSVDTPKDKSTQLSLDDSWGENVFEDLDEFVNTNKDIIDSTIAQLLSGSITATKIPDDKNGIYKTLSDRFNIRCLNKKELSYVISNHVTNVIESMIDHIEDSTIPDDIKLSLLSEACYSIIESMELKYPYIDETLNNLMCYVEQ